MKKQILFLLILLTFANIVYAAEAGQVDWVKFGDPDDDVDGDGLPDWALNGAYNDSSFRSNLAAGSRFAIVTKVTNTGTVPIDGFIWFHAIHSYCGLSAGNITVDAYSVALESFSAFRQTTDPGVTKITGFGNSSPMTFPNIVNNMSFVIEPTQSAYHVEIWEMPQKACPSTWQVYRDYRNKANAVVGVGLLPSFTVTNPSGEYVFYTTDAILKDSSSVEVAPPFGLGVLELLNYEQYTIDATVTNEGTSPTNTNLIAYVIDKMGSLCTDWGIIDSSLGAIDPATPVTGTGSYTPNGEGRTTCDSTSDAFFYAEANAVGENMLKGTWFLFTIAGPSVRLDSVYLDEYFPDEIATAHAELINDGSEDFPPGTMLTVKFSSYTPSAVLEDTVEETFSAPAAGVSVERLGDIDVEPDSFGTHTLIVEIYDGVILLDTVTTSFVYPHRVSLNLASVSGDIGEEKTAVLSIRNDYFTSKDIDLTSSDISGWLLFQPPTGPPADEIIGLSVPGESTIDIDVLVTPVCPAADSQTITISATAPLGEDVDLVVNVLNVAIACAVPNVPPVATIDSPAADETIIEGESLTFEGTGVDSDGSITSYDWTCVATSGTCPADFSSNVEDPGDIQFDTEGDYTITFNVQDDGGATDADQRIVIVEPPAPVVVEENAKILSCTINTNLVTRVAGDPAENIDVTVRARNTNTGADDLTVEITVTDYTDAITMVPPPSVTETKNVLQNATEQFDFSPAFGVDDGWSPNNYKVIAKVFDGSMVEQDVMSCGMLTVLETDTVDVDVPEIGLLLLPLIAAAVLFVISRKK